VDTPLAEIFSAVWGAIAGRRGTESIGREGIRRGVEKWENMGRGRTEEGRCKSLETLGTKDMIWFKVLVIL